MIIALETFASTEMLHFIFYCFVLGLGSGYTWKAFFQWF